MPIHGSCHAGGKHCHSAYRSGFVAKPYIAVVKPSAPVTFNAMAGMGAPVPAQTVINLGIAEPGSQVEALQALMNIFMDADAAAERARPDTPQGMVDAIRRHSQVGLSRTWTFLMCRHLGTVAYCRQKERPYLPADLNMSPFSTKMGTCSSSQCTKRARGGCVVATNGRFFDHYAKSQLWQIRKRTPPADARAAGSRRPPTLARSSARPACPRRPSRCAGGHRRVGDAFFVGDGASRPYVAGRSTSGYKLTRRCCCYYP